MTQDADRRPEGWEDDLPLGEPHPVDPEAVADAPEAEVTDADRPVDDEEFIHPAELEAEGPS